MKTDREFIEESLKSIKDRAYKNQTLRSDLHFKGLFQILVGIEIIALDKLAKDDKLIDEIASLKKVLAPK
jgi:hypothetical protein